MAKTSQPLGRRPRVTSFRGPAAGIGALRSVAGFVFRHTGLRAGVGLLRRVNQVGGFDCPGCAWPDPAQRSVAEFCENGAKAVLDEGTTKRADPAFFAAHTISDLATWTDRALNDAGRITHPMLREAGSDRYVPVSWDEAVAVVATALRGIRHPDRAVFYTSGRASNEAAFLYQLLARQLGTNNLPDCSNMCHESTGVGLEEVIGVGKGTVSLEDFDHADFIFVIGQNPGTNHPRMLSALQAAARRGARIVSINPLREAGLTRFKHPQEVFRILGPGTPIATDHLQVRINGDVALLQGLGKALLELEAARPGEVLDQAFLHAHTSGFAGYRAALATLDWEILVEESGISRAQMVAVAEAYAASHAAIGCWAMGLTQHENGVANVQEVTSLLLMRGNIGRVGAGVCPVRGHSNVQGDRTMGIWDRPTEAFLAALDAGVGITSPRGHGLNTIEAIAAMHTGRVDVFVGLGGNFVSAAPDTPHTSAAMARCGLTVQIATKLNRSHVVTGASALLLPCLGRTELDLGPDGAPRAVSVEDSMSAVHLSAGAAAPAGRELRSEVDIIAAIAARTLGERAAIDYSAAAADYDRVRDLIARSITGFADFNRRLREPGGMQLPNPARERVFRTPDGKARFLFHALPHRALQPGELLMMTIRSHDQFNTTVYSDDDRYRGIHGSRRVVLMNADDLRERGLVDRAAVDVHSHWRGATRTVRGFYAVPYDIPRGCCAMYFPEANPLVPVGQHAARSFTPASKSVVVTIVPATAPAGLLDAAPAGAAETTPRES
ncbi:MAG: FdhF/YdeP family oxidoreductase [Myxococcota bacterium]